MISTLGTVFMLHRVAPYQAKRTRHTENLKLSPEELEEVILELKKKNRIFLSLDEAGKLIESQEKPKKKFIVFTLDDGYKDNLEYAYPIFKKHNVPFCIYITNSFPNATTNLWWFALEDLLLQNKSLLVPGYGKIKNDSTTAQDKNFLLVRSQILDQHFRDPISFMNKMGSLSFDVEEKIKTLCMTWEDIKRISEDDLATIGCHTVNHYPLSKLDSREATNEIQWSKDEIEEKIKNTVHHFAFPFGGRKEAGHREYELAESIGFNTIATTINGHIYNGDHSKSLNRIFLFPLQPNRYTLNKLMYKNPLIYISYLRKYVFNPRQK